MRSKDVVAPGSPKSSRGLLTVQFDRLDLRVGDTVLDIGAGFGRHVFELALRGINVVALDRSANELRQTRARLRAMAVIGEIQPGQIRGVVRGDALDLPFAAESFHAVVATEILEHIHDDDRAIDELVRVLRPHGRVAVSVPSWLPESVNWKLSDEYRGPAGSGGHVRIYSKIELVSKLRSAGLQVEASRRAHPWHTPYWWMRCAFERNGDHSAVVEAYRRALDHGVAHQPRWWTMSERALAPLLGKSLVIYAIKKPSSK